MYLHEELGGFVFQRIWGDFRCGFDFCFFLCWVSLKQCYNNNYTIRESQILRKKLS